MTGHFHFMGSLVMVCCLPFNAYGSEVVPLAPKGVGVTMNGRPSLCWKMDPPAIDVIVRFTLADVGSSKSTLTMNLPISRMEKNESCYCVNLESDDFTLVPFITYRWSISILQDPESYSQDKVAGGMIEFCDPADCLDGMRELSPCSKNLVIRLRGSGLWYDSVSCLCHLLKSDPEDEQLVPLMARLLNDAGIAGTK